METYFSKFPIITYANNNIRDLSRRVRLENNLRQIPTAFYPYDLNNNMRSDVVSTTYYNDPDADWLIYITNGIIDPYYGWYLTEEEFDAYIIYKYGDLTAPQQTIAYWITNWMDWEVNMSVSFYNRLAPIQQKYWSPVWGPKDSIIAYKRRSEDWITNINRIINVEVANTEVFTVGDLVQSLSNTGTIIGTGQVMGIETNNSILQVGNILNTWDTTANTVCRRNLPLSNSAITDEIWDAVINITNDEIDYWTPVYQYDMEKELNESRKTIMLLDRGYLTDASRGLVQKLKEE